MKFLAGVILFLAILLRMYQFPSNPPSLHGDELGIGYNAYSLLLTGHDEYEKLLPSTFRNDFSPLIFYVSVPLISIFGLNEFSTRLPTLLIGIMMLTVIYIFSNIILKSKKYALLTLFLVATSSWHIRSTRINIEMTWALFFQLLAIVIFMQSKINDTKRLVLSFFFFGLSETSYQSAKMTTPLIIFGLFFLYYKWVKPHLKLLFTLFAVFIVSPIVLYLIVRPIYETRFAGISVFTLWRSMYSPERLISLQSIFELLAMIITNYFKHFDPRIWFLDNTSLRYYQLSQIGLFYLWQIPFIILGIISIIKKNKNFYLLLFLLLVSPLPAALTTGVPYSNIGRSMLMMPTVEVLCVIGIKTIFEYSRKRKISSILIILVMVLFLFFNFKSFLHQYFIDSPNRFSSFWGKSLKDMIPVVIQNEQKADSIIIADSTPQSYMYMLFYGNKTPAWLFSSNKERHTIVGYKNIGKYEFRPIDWKKDMVEKNVLIVGPTREIDTLEFKSIPSILSKNADFTLIKTPNSKHSN